MNQLKEPFRKFKIHFIHKIVENRGKINASPPLNMFLIITSNFWDSLRRLT